MGDLLSMTGFGRADAKANDLHVAAEVKTVNNRYLEISSKTSPTLTEFELRAKELTREYLDRGRVFMMVSDLSPRMKLEAIRLNEGMTRSLLAHLEELSKSLGFRDEITFQDLIPFAEQLHQNGFSGTTPELADLAEQALRTALENLTRMRRAEGKSLKEDFIMRLDSIEKGLAECEAMVAGNTDRRMEKLRDRIQTLLGMQELDTYRLEMEAVLMTDRLDITEEIVRMQSHCKQFRKIVNHGGPCGRRMGFLIQEMNRELNTASAKADLPELSHLVVEMKEELERMREQAQNVE
ncbi:MAG: YicC family protein [FCB group bacterium]|nr:YicC family protein [FCB group bacterium]